MTDEKLLELASEWFEVLDNYGDWDGCHYLEFRKSVINGPEGNRMLAFMREVIRISGEQE